MVGASMQYLESIPLPTSSLDSVSAPPLDYEHISVRGGVRKPSAEVKALPGGFQVKRILPSRPQEGGGKRGTICGFSEGSRRRLNRTLQGIPWKRVQGHFVGLTWHFGWQGGEPTNGPCVAPVASPPASVPGSPPTVEQVRASRLWKAKLHAFRNRFFRKYGDELLGAIWKLEFQKRGAAHFHLVVMWKGGRKPEDYELWKWIAYNWNEIAEPGDPDHLKHGSDCQAIKAGSGGQMRALMRYLSKYIAKEYEHDGETGRIWGVWGQLPQEVIDHVGLRWVRYCELVRRLRRWGRGGRYLEHMTADRNGFSVWYDGEALLQLLRGLTT